MMKRVNTQYYQVLAMARSLTAEEKEFLCIDLLKEIPYYDQRANDIVGKPPIFAIKNRKIFKTDVFKYVKKCEEVNLPELLQVLALAYSDDKNDRRYC